MIPFIPEYDPRELRTRAHILEVARRLLPDLGVTKLTYTRLSREAQVSRATLYRHWPSLSTLWGDIALERLITIAPIPGTDLLTVATQCLDSLREAIQSPQHSAALTSLMAQADRDPISSRTLADYFTTRHKTISELFALHGLTVSREQFGTLVGPIVFRRFLSREPITHEYLADHAATWLLQQNDASAAA